MAGASLGVDSVQFSCSICLERLREPVTIPCGHSYCMACLSDYWDGQRHSSCPQCRAVFKPRPKLGRNNLLVEMMEKLGVMGPSAPPMEEAVGFQHPTFDLSLVRPERNMEQKLVGETRRNIAAEIQRKELEFHQLRNAQTSFCRQVKVALKDSSSVFSELQEFLERRRVEMKELIRAQEKSELTRAETHLQHLEKQMLELRRRDAELHRLSQLQNLDQNLIIQVCQPFSAPGSAESLSVVPDVSFGVVRNIVSDLKDQLQNFYLSEFQAVATAVKSVNLLQFSSTVVRSPPPVLSVKSRYDLLHYFTPLSLDVFSAHQELSLSEGNRTVSRDGDVQSYPDHPERFDSWTQVLSKEELRGRSYWEAEWEGQVTLGVAYATMDRKGSSDVCRLGHNPQSWSLQCGPSFSFSHNKHTEQLSAPPPSSRVGVLLDYDVGLLCFYSVSDGRILLLHTHQERFHQRLYAAMWLGYRAKVSLCMVD
ncbi:E3 ubiquitin-protein ligase TRIM11-like isoform X2 [Gouania willdenowi]|uniref:E3 ubiquitin-protein ligase TRIM11-like isoform X2 n=1 Tax=Gouania willdenowi TaxID=441366 RepID=UPI00105559E3|nr:E3 ubiquitin-protein ligase TRIM11-like isoform X2 [Gouania willdenowi]